MNRNLSVALLISAFCLSFPAPAEAQLGGLLSRKSAVTEVTAEQVRKLQTDQAAAEKQAVDNGTDQPSPKFILVDARTEKEYAVSVIPGAIPANQYEQNREKYQGRTVICYCTSGYRSEQYARKLVQQGVDAKNFKGSILGWCAAKCPLETLQREPTDRVHTYNSRNHVPSEYKAVW